MILSNAEVIKECKDEARKHGLVFTKNARNNLYHFHDRKTKEIVLGNQTLGTAYNNVCSGYVSCYDKDAQEFDRECLMNLGLI